MVTITKAAFPELTVCSINSTIDDLMGFIAKIFHFWQYSAIKKIDYRSIISDTMLLQTIIKI